MLYTVDEDQEVRLRRIREAVEAGMTLEEARVFAASGVDIGLLRACVAGGCPVDVLRRILL